MNQTRVFLIFAWLMVAVLLYMEWTREKTAPPPAPTTSSAPSVGAVPSAAGTVPGQPVPSAKIGRAHV